MQHAVVIYDLLFIADDSSMSCQVSILEEYQKNLTIISSSLCSNKLTLCKDKTDLVKLNKFRDASNFSINLLNITCKLNPAVNFYVLFLINQKK